SNSAAQTLCPPIEKLSALNLSMNGLSVRPDLRYSCSAESPCCCSSLRVSQRRTPFSYGSQHVRVSLPCAYRSEQANTGLSGSCSRKGSCFRLLEQQWDRYWPPLLDLDYGRLCLP